MIRPLLASLRIANAPSVVSNVILGYLLGRFYWGDAGPLGPTLGWLAAAALLLYFAGNLANDWFDRDWDATHRPERALPQGVFRRGTYLEAAIVGSVLGIAFAFVAAPGSGVTALGILASIIIYTLIHKRSAWGVLPMGLCRAGLYVVGFLAAWPSDLHSLAAEHAYGFPHAWHFDIVRGIAFIGMHALGLVAYIAGLSLAARCESMTNPPRSTLVLARALLLLPLLALSFWWVPHGPVAGLLALVPFAIWMGLSMFRKPVPRLVAALLAGIPLIDWIAALPLGVSLILPGTTPGSASWLAFLVPPTAFATALILQKFSPAT